MTLVYAVVYCSGLVAVMAVNKCNFDMRNHFIFFLFACIYTL